MPIDPVILLVEELRSVELALSKATQTYRRTSQREDGEVINLLLGKLKRLFSKLFETLPTSSSGAAEAAPENPIAPSASAPRATARREFATHPSRLNIVVPCFLKSVCPPRRSFGALLAQISTGQGFQNVCVRAAKWFRRGKDCFMTVSRRRQVRKIVQKEPYQFHVVTRLKYPWSNVRN